MQSQLFYFFVFFHPQQMADYWWLPSPSHGASYLFNLFAPYFVLNIFELLPKSWMAINILVWRREIQAPLWPLTNVILLVFRWCAKWRLSWMNRAVQWRWWAIRLWRAPFSQPESSSARAWMMSSGSTRTAALSMSRWRWPSRSPAPPTLANTTVTWLSKWFNQTTANLNRWPFRSASCRWTRRPDKNLNIFSSFPLRISCEPTRPNAQPFSSWLSAATVTPGGMDINYPTLPFRYSHF